MWRRLLHAALPFLCVQLLASPLKDNKHYDYSKGLDTYHSSLSLPDGFVQSSLNVVFDAKAPVTKRQGYTIAFSSKSYAFQNAWTYVDPSNTSWIITRTSDSIIANNLSGSASVLIATVSANNLVGEVNAFGDAFFTDQTQGVYLWNGTATTYVIGSPKGSLITQWHGRVWVSGLAVPNGSQLWGSRQYDATSSTAWGTGVNPNDPVTLVVGLQDNFDNITALYPFLDTLYTFRHFSTYAVYGFDQTSFQLSFITAECGCIDQNSIQTYNHTLVFASERGVESFNGYTCTRISDPVKNLLDPAIQAQSGVNAQSWVQSSVSDWNSGTSFATFTDTTTTPGVVQLPQFHEAWNSLSAWNILFGSFILSPGFIGSTGAGPDQVLQTVRSFNLPNQFYLSYKTTLFVDGGIPPYFALIDSCAGVSDSRTTFGHGYGVCLQGNGDGTQRVDIRIWAGHGFNGVLSQGSNFTMDGSTHTLALSRSATGYMQAYLDGAINTTANDTTYSSFIVPDLECTAGNAGRCNILPFDFSVSSGSFKSQIHNTGPVNSWGNFSSQDVLNDGNIIFSVCSSTNSNMGPPASCASQTPNAPISLATGTYVQWYATFTVTADTQTPSLSGVTVSWFSGNRSSPMSSTVWDNRYLLSLTTNTADSFNDAMLVLDTAGAWGLYDIHAGGLVQYKNNLYHSDSLSSGNVYLDNQGYRDNGNAISAYVRTKDLCGEDITSDDYYESLYVSEDNLGNFNTTIGYFMDRDPTLYSLSSVNQTEFASNTAIKIPFVQSASNQNFSKCISLLFTESDLDSPWDFYGFSTFSHSRAVQ